VLLFVAYKEDDMSLSDEKRVLSMHIQQKIKDLYHAWDDAMARADIAALVNLYTPDAEIESPLICELSDPNAGMLRGRAAFRSLYEEVVRCQSDVIRPRHHDNYFTDGRRIIWEYPRLTPDGEQSEFVECWDLDPEFLIARHRVYWGWSRIVALHGKGFDAV
jgi:hypothetical protein